MICDSIPKTKTANATAATAPVQALPTQGTKAANRTTDKEKLTVKTMMATNENTATAASKNQNITDNRVGRTTATAKVRNHGTATASPGLSISQTTATTNAHALPISANAATTTNTAENRHTKKMTAYV